MSQLDTFMARYQTHLRIALRDYPDEYAFPLSEVETVCLRMRDAIHRESFHKDSRAIKATCRELGIKHTYSAIREWLSKGACHA